MTLLELIIACTILMILSSAALPIARFTVVRERERELRRDLRDMRNAIDRYKDYADRGMIRTELGSENYPPDLDTLVKGVAMGGAGGAEGGGVVLPGAAGTITTVLNTVIPVVGAFLLFNYVFNIPNFDSQLAALQAYMINWFETDPLAAELYVAQQQLAALQAQLASFPAGQAARTQLLNVIAMQQNQVNALVAQIRKQGIPKLPKS